MSAGRCYASLFAALTIVALPLAAQAPKAAAAKSIWQGQSAGFNIDWTASDLTARRTDAAPNAEPAFSLRPAARHDFDAFAADNRDSGGCTWERKARPVSVVGTLLSVRLDNYTSCKEEAHPASDWGLATFDISRAGASSKPVVLTDLFNQRDILKALLADRIIQSGMDNEPERLADLPGALNQDGLEAPGAGECRFTLSPDFLTRFAFHHVEGNRVAIRLALTPVGGACRAAEAMLGLLLPVPKTLAPALEQAAASRQGFLMKDARKVAAPAPAGVTVIRFQTSSAARRK